MLTGYIMCMLHTGNVPMNEIPTHEIPGCDKATKELTPVYEVLSYDQLKMESNPIYDDVVTCVQTNTKYPAND